MLTIPELKLLGCSDETAFLTCFEQHAQRLTSTWLGRRIVAIKARFLNEKQALKTTAILRLFEISLLKVHEASHIWTLWQLLRTNGIYTKNGMGLAHVWLHLKKGSEEPSLGFKVWHKVTSTCRIVFRMIGYYFGVDPRFLFGAKSFWDLEQRFTSLKHLSGILVTASLGVYQAIYLSSLVISSLALEISVVSQALLVSGLALASIAALGVLFYKMGRWFGGIPLEIWKCQNLTFEVSHHEEPLSFGREKELSQLLSFFASSKSQVALIRAEAGLGKTVLVKEFARRLAKDVLPPMLMRPQVFLLNAAQINGEAFSQPTEKLNVIRDQIEGYEHSIILAIDEAHCLNGACVELLKQWKEEGLRIILLTNSLPEDLKKQWSDATYDSFLSHTKTTTIKLTSNEELLRKILEQYLEQNPHLVLSGEVKKHLIQWAVKQKSNPRALYQALLCIGAQEKTLQCYQKEILEISQAITDGENELAREAEKGNWDQASSRAHQLENHLKRRGELLYEAGERHAYIERVQKQRTLFKSLRSLVGTWVRSVKVEVEEKYFLDMVQRVLTQASLPKEISFASQWDKERIMTLIS